MRQSNLKRPFTTQTPSFSPNKKRRTDAHDIIHNDDVSLKTYHDKNDFDHDFDDDPNYDRFMDVHFDDENDNENVFSDLEKHKRSENTYEDYKNYHRQIECHVKEGDPIFFKIREILDIPQLDGIVLSGKTSKNEGIHVLVKMDPYIYMERKKPFKTERSVEKFLIFLEGFIRTLQKGTIACRNPYLIDESYRYSTDEQGMSIYSGQRVDPTVTNKKARVNSSFLFDDSKIDTKKVYGYDEKSPYNPHWSRVLNDPFVHEEYKDVNDDCVSKTRRKSVLLTHKFTSSHYCVESLRIAKVSVRKPFFAFKLKELFESFEYYEYATRHVTEKCNRKNKISTYHFEDYMVRTYESEYQFYTNMASKSILVGKWHNMTNYTLLGNDERFSFKNINATSSVKNILCEPEKELLVPNRIASYDIETAAGSTKYSTDASRFPIAFQGFLPNDAFKTGRAPSVFSDRVEKSLEKYTKDGIDVDSFEFRKNTDPVVIFGVVIRDEGVQRGFDYAEGKIFVYKRKLANPTESIRRWKKKLTRMFVSNLEEFKEYYEKNEDVSDSDSAKKELETVSENFSKKQKEDVLVSKLKWFYDKIEIVECDSEMEMFFSGMKYIHLNDVDIISGWNTDFDDNYSIMRWYYHRDVKNYRHMPNFNMTCFVDGISKLNFKNNRLYVNHDGYVSNDGYAIFQKNKEDLPNYKLGFVAHELLKYPKHIVNTAIIMAHGALKKTIKVAPKSSKPHKTTTTTTTIREFFDNYKFINDATNDDLNAFSLKYLKLLWNASNDKKFASDFEYYWKTNESDPSETFELCMKKIEWSHSSAAVVSKTGGYDMTLYSMYNVSDNLIPIYVLSKKGIFVAQESFASVTGCNYSAVYTEGQMYKVVGALRIRCKTNDNDEEIRRKLNDAGDEGDDSSTYLFPDTGNLHLHYAGVFRGDQKCDDMVRKKYNEYALLYKLRKYQNAKLKLNPDLTLEQNNKKSSDQYLFDTDVAIPSENVSESIYDCGEQEKAEMFGTNVPIICDKIGETDYSNVVLYGLGIDDATSNQGGKVLVPFQQGFHKAFIFTDDAGSMYPANMVGAGLDKEQMTNSQYAKDNKIPKYKIHNMTIGAHHLNIAGEVLLSEKEAIFCGSESVAVKQTNFLTTETGVVYDLIMSNFTERQNGKDNKVLWGAGVKPNIPETTEEIRSLCKNPVKIMMTLLSSKTSWAFKKYDVSFEKLCKLGLICDKIEDSDDYFKSKFGGDLQSWKDCLLSNLNAFKDKKKIFSIVNVIDRFSEFEDRISAIQTAELWADNYDKYQLAVKCLMNSLYGIFMMLYGPLSEPAISATVTAFGRFLISCVQCSIERQTATFVKRATGAYENNPSGLNPSFAKSKSRAAEMPEKPFPIEETPLRTIKGIGKLFRVMDDGVVDLVVSLFKTIEALFALYGDTDSVMIKLPFHSIVNGDQAYDAMERSTDMINTYMFSKIIFQPEKYSKGMIVTSRQKTYDMMAFMERKKDINWLFKGADKSDIMPFLRTFINDCKEFLFAKSSEGFETHDILSIIFLKTQKMLLKFATNQLPISLIAVSKKLNKYTRGGSAQHNVVADKKKDRGETVTQGDIIVFIPVLEIVNIKKTWKKQEIVQKKVVHTVEDADYVLNNINTITIDYENIFEKKIKNCLLAFLSSVFAKINDLPYADSPFTSVRNFKMSIVTQYMEQIEKYIESVLLHGPHGILTRFHMRKQMLNEKISKLKKKPTPLRECACCFSFYRDHDGEYDALSSRLPEKIGPKLVTVCPTCRKNADYHKGRFYKKLQKMTVKYRVQRTICTVCIEAPLTPKPQSFSITPESCEFTLCSVYQLKSHMRQQIGRLENLIFSFDIYSSEYISNPDSKKHIRIEYDEQGQQQRKTTALSYTGDVSLNW